MQKIIALSAIGVFAAFSVALAAPTGAADKNPQIVAYYPTGPHGIPGEAEYHEGMDIVMKTGRGNGNFQQWFYGTSASEGLHGEHSVWKVSKDGTCDQDWVLMPDPHPEWGDYLTPNVNYCVKTNDFRPSK